MALVKNLEFEISERFYRSPRLFMLIDGVALELISLENIDPYGISDYRKSIGYQMEKLWC